jgi:hypothetical protein
VTGEEYEIRNRDHIERGAYELYEGRNLFHIETFACNWKSVGPRRTARICRIVAVFARAVGSPFAMVLGMNTRPATRHRDGTISFVCAMREFAGASLVALAFAFAILLIGTPIALIVRGLHDTFSWLVRVGGDMTAPVEALVSVASVGGGLILTAVLVRLLVGVFHWRRSVRVLTWRQTPPRQCRNYSAFSLTSLMHYS